MSVILPLRTATARILPRAGDKPLSRLRERGWGEGLSAPAPTSADMTTTPVLDALRQRANTLHALEALFVGDEKPLSLRERGWGEGTSEPAYEQVPI